METGKSAFRLFFKSKNYLLCDSPTRHNYYSLAALLNGFGQTGKRRYRPRRDLYITAPPLTILYSTAEEVSDDIDVAASGDIDGAAGGDIDGAASASTTFS